MQLRRALDVEHPDFQLHDFRHSRASHLLGKISDFRLHKFLGHKKLQTTSQYVHTDLADVADVILGALVDEHPAAEGEAGAGAEVEVPVRTKQNPSKSANPLVEKKARSILGKRIRSQRKVLPLLL